MMTTALQRVERTPPNDQGLHGRIESNRDDRPGDFSDYLKSPKGKPARTTSRSNPSGTGTAEAADVPAHRLTLGETASLASLLLAQQVPVMPPVPPAADPAISSHGSKDDEADGAVPNPTDSAKAGNPFDSMGSEVDSRSGESANTADAEKGKIAPKEEKPAIAPKEDGVRGGAVKGQDLIASESSAAGKEVAEAFKTAAESADNPADQTIAQAPAAVDANLLTATPALNEAVESVEETQQAGAPVAPVVTGSSRSGAKGKVEAAQQADPKADAPTESSGTPAASTEMTMHFAHSQNGFAGSGKQDLPGRQSGSSQLKSELPVGAVGLSGAGGLGGSPSPALEIPPVQNMTTQAEQVTQRIERIGELLHTECMLMRQVKPASLSAVLRPDAETEIHIQLRFDRNGIEATCRCEKGDMQSLQSGWTDLQRQLSQQGVRLMPIQGASETAGTASSWSMGSGGQNSPRRESNDQERQPAFWGLPALASSLTNRPAPAGSPVIPGTSRHMLESWA